MVALTVLKNHAEKLRADNEYVDRQIVFLTDRLKGLKDLREQNGKDIAGIEAMIDEIAPF